MNYFIQWSHVYSAHFGAWVTFVVASSVHKKGVPKNIWPLLKSALAMSAVLSLFSSHAHVHYANFLTHMVK